MQVQFSTKWCNELIYLNYIFVPYRDLLSVIGVLSAHIDPHI